MYTVKENTMEPAQNRSCHPLRGTAEINMQKTLVNPSSE